MKRATIDIGTNSVRLLFKGETEKATFKRVEITRLGKGVNETGLIEASRMDATTEAVRSFVQEAKANGARSIHIMATSAARDARNGRDLLEAIYQATGLWVEIISGDLEAEIGFKGVVSGFPQSEQLNLVIDIGGGSTELIVGNYEGIKYSTSIDIGSVRMTGAHVHSDPISLSDDALLRSAIEGLTQEALEAVKAFGLSKAIGIGGTCATLLTLYHEVGVYTREAVHGKSLSLAAVTEVNARLKALSIEERKALVGLEPKRADVIYAGGCILECVMRKLGLKEMIFSDYDNLEGYMIFKCENEEEI